MRQPKSWPKTKCAYCGKSYRYFYKHEKKCKRKLKSDAGLVEAVDRLKLSTNKRYELIQKIKELAHPLLNEMEQNVISENPEIRVELYLNVLRATLASLRGKEGGGE